MQTEKIGNVEIELSNDRRILNFDSLEDMKDAGIQIGKKKSIDGMDIFYVKKSGGQCISRVEDQLYLNDWAVETDLHK